MTDSAFLFTASVNRCSPNQRSVFFSFAHSLIWSNPRLSFICMPAWDYHLISINTITFKCYFLRFLRILWYFFSLAYFYLKTQAWFLLFSFLGNLPSIMLSKFSFLNIFCLNLNRMFFRSNLKREFSFCSLTFLPLSLFILSLQHVYIMQTFLRGGLKLFF